MAANDEALIECALAHRFLTRRQADLVRQDMAQSGRGAADVMAVRSFVTAEQLGMILAEAGMGSGSSAAPAMGAHPTIHHPTASASLDEIDVLPPSAASAMASAPKMAQSRAVPESEPTQRVVTPTAAPVASPATAAPASAAAPATPNHPEVAPNVEGLLDLLSCARHWGCSDLHLSTGRPPFVRLGGKIRYMEKAPLSPETSEAVLFSALTDRQREILLSQQSLDFALQLENLGRFRVNIFKQRLGWDGAFRVVRGTVPTIDELSLPTICKTLTDYHQGMVLVTGAGGSGKTTTIAAMLDFINRHREDHIITVEDPIEYVMKPLRCQVTQREVGRHTESFGKALRAALREDPDIILVGEMRDMETVSIAISAAETGHLVFGTLHTSSAARTVSRILDVYPPNQQQQIATMISESIRGILSQQLVPRADGAGVVLALEILIFTSGVGQLVREGKTFQLVNQMQAGKKLGMRLMDESLMELLRANTITGAEAYARAENKQPFEQFKNQQ